MKNETENDTQYKCTVCGRIGSVGRCCGIETRIPVSDCQERLVMPSSFRIPLIEVFYRAGDPPFVCGVNGNVTTGMLDEIEADIDENSEDLLREGCGTYLFKATRFSGQYDEKGRCELSPCWELDLVLFSSANSKITE